MQTLTLKMLFRYLPLFIVLAIAMGVFMTSRLLQKVLDTQTETIIISRDEALTTCISPLIYTSLPPKCKTADGTFIKMDGIPSNILVMPPGK